MILTPAWYCDGMARSSQTGVPTPLALAVAVVVAVAWPAAAQRVLLSRYSGGTQSTDLYDLSAGTTHHLSDEYLRGSLFTSAGDIVIYSNWEGPPRAQAVAGGAEFPLPFWPWLVHARETAVFGGVTAGAVGRLDAAGLRAWPVCPSGEVLLSMDMAPGTDLLFVRCTSGAVAVLDAVSGQIRKWLPLASGGDVRDVVATDEGRALLAVVHEAGAMLLQRIDVASATVLASVAWPAPVNTIGRLRPTPSRRHVVVAACPPGAGCAAWRADTQTLTLSAPLQADALALANDRFAVDPREEVLFTWNNAGFLRTSLATGALLDVVYFPWSPGLMSLSMTWPPLEPLVDPPVVQARSVSLAWTLGAASPQATGFLLEAGLTPGTTALSIDLGKASAVTIPGVPPGRYFVRLRAVNGTGTSPPSAEIVVDVP